MTVGTDTVTWDGGLTAHVDADTCHTAIRMVGYCAVSGIEGNTVYYAGDNFGIGANTYLPWATACENGTPNVYPILYVLFEERGLWQDAANDFWGAHPGNLVRRGPLDKPEDGHQRRGSRRSRALGATATGLRGGLDRRRLRVDPGQVNLLAAA